MSKSSKTETIKKLVERREFLGGAVTMAGEEDHLSAQTAAGLRGS
jgi:hypothetical protein